MNKNVKRALFKSLKWNLLAGLFCALPFIFLHGDAVITWGLILIAIAVISLFIQFIIGCVYSFGEENKEQGQGMLLSIGIILLIGVAVCTPFWL